MQMFPLIQTGFQFASSLDWSRPIGHFSVVLFIVSVCVFGAAVGSKIWGDGGDGLTGKRRNTWEKVRDG